MLPRIDYIWQSNAGAGAARNTGIRASRNEFVAFLDSDDEWASDKTERQLAAFRHWPEVVLVAGRGIERYADGRTVPHPLPVPDLRLDQPTDFAAALFDQNIMATPSVMVRRRCFDQAGLFREDLPRSQDYHMWARLACRGPCVFLDAPLCTWAADTPDSLQRDRESALRSNLRARQLLKRELRRRPDCRGIWHRALARHLATLRDRSYHRGGYADALRFGLRSLVHQPWRRQWWEWGLPVRAFWHWLASERTSVPGGERCGVLGEVRAE